jgi:MoaA/NifB/PqqE/SkfB family radical SAM enzyme
VHDRIRNMPGTWERAVETLRRLRELRSRRFEVYFGMTLQDGNAGAFEDTVAAVRQRIGDISYDDFHVNVMHTSHYYGNSGCGGIRDKDKVLRALADVRRARKSPWASPVAYLERRYQAAADRYLRTGRSGVACQALSASLFLDPSGTVYPCTTYESAVGKLRDVDYDLRRLWVAERRTASRQEVRKGNCPGCWTPCEAYQSILAGVLRPVKRQE